MRFSDCCDSQCCEWLGLGGRVDGAAVWRPALWDYRQQLQTHQWELATVNTEQDFDLSTNNTTISTIFPPLHYTHQNRDWYFVTVVQKQSFIQAWPFSYPYNLNYAAIDALFCSPLNNSNIFYSAPEPHQHSHSQSVRQSGHVRHRCLRAEHRWTEMMELSCSLTNTCALQGPLLSTFSLSETKLRTNNSQQLHFRWHY